MYPTLTTLLKSIVGKVLIGVTVVTMGVGAAAAAGADVPVLVNSPEESSSEDTASEDTASEDTASEDTASEDTASEDTASEDTASEDTASEDTASEDTASEDTASEDTEESEDESSEDASNHGAVVSEFTRTTDLMGCEKGQATAAVARGDVDPTELDAATLSTALEPFIAKCAKADEGSDENTDEDAEADDDGAPAEWQMLRDQRQAEWLAAKDAYVAACGDDDADGDGGAEDETEPTAECRALKADLKDLHEAGRAEWHQARDDAKAERRSASATEDDAANGNGNGKANGKGKANGNAKANGNGRGKDG